MNDEQRKKSAIIALIAGICVPFAVIELLKAIHVELPLLEISLILAGMLAIAYSLIMFNFLKHKKSDSRVKYVASLSANAKVFHRPSCRSVKMMSRENMMTYGPEITYQHMINAGMQPCSKCKPR